MCKLLVPSRSGRTGEGHPRVCWRRTSLSTLFRSATIILMSWQNSIYKELALYIHHFLAASAKSYNDTA